MWVCVSVKWFQNWPFFFTFLFSGTSSTQTNETKHKKPFFLAVIKLKSKKTVSLFFKFQHFFSILVKKKIKKLQMEVLFCQLSKRKRKGKRLVIFCLISGEIRHAKMDTNRQKYVFKSAKIWLFKLLSARSVAIFNNGNNKKTAKMLWPAEPNQHPTVWSKTK